MRNPFRRTAFPGKYGPPPTEEEKEAEYMTPRVDTDDVPVSLTMQELAASIVRNPAFDTVCRKIRSDQLRLLMSTKAEEIQERESAAARIRALDEVVLALGALGMPEAKLHPKRGVTR